MISIIIMLTLSEFFCGAFECFPQNYEISKGNPYQRYCEDSDGGGSCSEGPWTWVAAAGCKEHAGLTNQRDCPCHGYACGSGSVFCKCGSDKKSDSTQCYTKLSYCMECVEPGKYRLDCGCYLGKVYTDNGIYVFGQESLRPFYTNWVCSSGICASCPKGNMCPLSVFPTQPTPCPADTYQNFTGQTSCISSLCERSKYNANYVSTFDNTAFSKLCLPCDECTDAALITGKSQQDLCPLRDKSMGMIGGVCSKCLSCSGKYYAMVDAVSEFCLKNILLCIEQYYDNNADLGLNPQENEQALGGLFKVGKMPWKRGFMRVEPIYRNVAGKEGVGRRGMIPYYKPCEAGVYSGRYRATTNQLLVNKLNDGNWYDDCSPYLTRECSQNHYAILSSEIFADGFRRLISCEPCQENTLSSGTGGLSTECPCKTGFASQETLRSKFGLNNVFIQGTAENVATCVNCSHGVYWRHHGSNLVWQEALVCLADTVVGVRWCEGREYWDAVTGRCVQCPVINPGNKTAIPEKNRIGYKICPKGTHNREGTDGFTCEECYTVDDGTYQDFEGQAECKLKAERCDAGSSLVPNYHNDRDNDCELCPADCGLGKITIMSANKTKSKDTCDGNKQSFFGCFDEGIVGVLGVSPDKRLVYNSLTQTETMATIETCDRNLLPRDADWVSYRTPNAIGAECYFACLHGVNDAISRALNSLIMSHVYAERQDLVNHLVSNSQGLITTKARVANINVDTMWSLSLSSFSYSSLSNWNVQVQQPVISNVLNSDAVIGKAFSSNTFLFIDEVMRHFNLSSLCVPAEKAYSVPCLDGYIKPVGWMKDLKCALHARTNLFHITPPSQPFSISSTSIITSDSNVSLAFLENGIYSVGCMDAVSTSVQCSEICQSENGDLSRFRAGCTENCMDRRLKLASTEQDKYIPFSAWYNHLAWIKYFLQASAWSARNFGNPYIMIDSPGANNCLFRCSSPLTFRYSTLDHILPGSMWSTDVPTEIFAACIPCSLGQQICSDFNPPRYFLRELCANNNEGMELTAAYVCSTCEQEKPNAVVISPGSDRYGEWLTSRINSGISRYLIMDGNRDYIWSLVRCRYTCNAGYTSTGSSPYDYNISPCMPCNEAIPESCKNNTDRGIPTYRTTSLKCGNANNVIPYSYECALCNVGADQEKFLFFSQGNATISEPFSSQGDCLAMCNSKIYHSIKTTASSAFEYVQSPIPYRDLACHLCSSNPGRPCGGDSLCPENGFYYRNASTFQEAECVACNTSPCPLNYYREMCIPGFIQDALCLPCPESSLYNDPDSAHFAWWSDALLNAVQENQNRVTRKWIYSETRGGMATYLFPFSQCKVACINNYAWVNLSSGLSPTPSFSGKLTADLYCLPCIGSYISSGLMPGTNPLLLYSFWNSSNISTDVPATLPGSALNSMTNHVLGGCYTCPGGGTRDVVYDSKEMCEIRAGRTENNQGSYGVAIISPLLSVTGIVDIQNFMANIDWFGGGENITSQQRRRRLLFSSSGVATPSSSPTIKLVRVRLQPLVSNGDYFTCCSKLNNAVQRQDCRKQWVSNLENKKNLEGTNWGINYCLTGSNQNNGRRLLSTMPSQTEEMAISLIGGGLVEFDDAGTCFSGTYKEDRGQGPCYVCPAGSSTSYPYSGAVNRSLCMCMPGFFSIRNISTRSLLHCEPCGLNFARGPLSNNDSVCFPCEKNTYAPTSTSSYCYCNAGTYRNSTGESCVFCEPGFYCSNSIREMCPANSMSASGSSSRGDCICDPKGYYGTLFSLDSQCIASPPGLKCVVSGLGALSCGCAPGWNRFIDSYVVDAMVLIRAHCETPCIHGQYAVLSLSGDQSITKCTPCPENSYSSNSQTIEYPGKPHSEQCTPCPLNSLSREGSQSISYCSCSSKNTSGIGCGICEGGSYMEQGVGCVECPSGTTSIPGGNGIQSCICPPGNRAVKVFNPNPNDNNSSNNNNNLATSMICEPCPRGFYSRNVGSSCTACGKDLTTAFSGSKSLRDCI